MGHYVVAVDIGTTTIRACLFLSTAGQPLELVHHCSQSVVVEVSGEEELELRVEIDPQHLFQQFLALVRENLSYTTSNDHVSLAICTQRNSIICWDNETKEIKSKLICWNDGRARKSCAEWNNSLLLKTLNTCGSLLHFFTRMPRFKGAAVLKFLSALITHRIMVTIEQSSELQTLLDKNRLSFGTIDSWLLYQLSLGKVYVAEATNIASSGAYDPYIMDYNHTVMKMIGFPLNVLASKVIDSASSVPIVDVHHSFFGRTIPVHAVMADQSAAVFGCGCVEEGDVKVSLGTGTFLNINTSKRPMASMRGLYPLIAWSVNGNATFMAEGNDHDTASLLRWAKSLQLFDDVQETSALAYSVPSTHGVLFVPAFGGLQTPINDDHACCAFLGIRPDTSKSHMLRAILESIVFRVYQIFETMQKEKLTRSSRIRICGGVGQNDFVCQSIANMFNRAIERVADGALATARGVAMLAAQVQGWQQSNDCAIERVFTPIQEERVQLLQSYRLWLTAVERCREFYKE